MSTADRNARLCLVFQASQQTPLFWAYMFHYVTGTHGLSAAEFGLLKAIYYVGVLALELPLGVVADRLGRRGVMTLGASFAVLSNGLYWLTPGFWGFAAGEAAMAASTALISGATAALLYDSFAAEGRAPEYPRAEGRRIGIGSGTATVGLLLADFALVRDGDPTWTYPATALIAGVGLLAALAMREPARQREHSARRIASEALRDLLGTPALVWVILYGGIVFVGLRAANALVFNPVMASASIPVDRYGTVTAGITLLAALTSWRAQGLVARLGATRVLVGMPVFVALLYGAAALWPGAPTALLLGLHGIPIGLLSVVISVLLNERIPSSERRATLLSFESMASRGSYAIAVVGFGWALDVGSLAAVLLGLGATSLLAAGLGGLAARSTRLPEAGSAERR